MKFWKACPIISFICAHFLSCPCLAMLRIPGRFPTSVASIHPPTKTIIFYSQAPGLDCSRGFDASTIEPVRPYNEVDSSDISKMIPQDMQATSDGGQVAARIADRSMNSLMDSPLMKSSDIGRAAKSVEHSMQADMSVGGTEPDSVKHSFHFDVQAAQTKAQLKYEGITHANLTYQVSGQTLNFEVREPMKMMKTDLVYNHVDTWNDRRDTLSVRWIW